MGNGHDGGARFEGINDLAHEGLHSNNAPAVCRRYIPIYNLTKSHRFQVLYLHEAMSGTGLQLRDLGFRRKPKLELPILSHGAQGGSRSSLRVCPDTEGQRK